MTATSHLPATLPVLPGVALSGRYLLSEEPPATRGDLLDGLPLPGRKVALFTADVVGSGPDAGAAAAQVRAILRERLGAGAGLLGAMESLDRYAHANPELCAAGVCVATLGLDDGIFEWIAAGHPAPLRVSAEGAEFLRSSSTRPLGTGARLTIRTSRLDEGDMVALFTNGLVSFEGRHLAEGSEQLAATAATALATVTSTTSSAERGDEVGDRLLRALVPARGSEDDVALLIALRSRRPEPFRLRTAATPENLPAVRHQINVWLDGLGAGLLDHVGLGHAVVELAANVVEHAYDGARPGGAGDGIQIDGSLEDDGTVCICVVDHGRWREQARGGGRGLMMASGLADTMRMVRTARGTRVELTQRLTRPVPVLHAVATESMERTLDESGELEIHADPGELVASGPLDELASDLLHAGLTRATLAGTGDAVVDLDAVTHLGSPSVQTIFEFVARSARTGTHLTLRAGPQSPAAQILELVGLPVRS